MRDWLTRKQRETRKGRAELRLAERASLWNAKPENRHLPSLPELLSIRALTDAAHWTEPQRKMMRQATRRHAWRSSLTLAGLIAVVAAGAVLRNQVANQREATRIEGLVGRLVSAEPAQVPEVVKQLDANPGVAAPLLASLISGKAETMDQKRAQLHARLASVSRDSSQVEPLVEELLAGKVAYVLPIRQLLGPAGARLVEQFRGLLRDDKADPERRFRAALALADYVPASEAVSWTEADLKFVAGQLVSANAEYQPLFRGAAADSCAIARRPGAPLRGCPGDRRPAARRRQCAGRLRRERRRPADRLAPCRHPGAVRRALPDRCGQQHDRRDRGPRQDRRHSAARGAGVSRARRLRPAARAGR